MPGGYKNIKPSDNKKPFTQNYNGKDFAKWTEDVVHQILDELEDWLLEEKPILNDKKEVVTMVDKGNVFYREFLFKKKLFADWMSYVQSQFSTVAERFKYIDSIQEHKLQKLAFEGKGKENITKFILQNKYEWREKSDQKVDQTLTQIEWKEEKTYSNEKEGDK